MRSKFLLFFPLVALLLIGCQKDLRMENIDTTMRVNVGAAMPLGNLRITLNDLIGTSMEEGGIIIDSLSGDMSIAMQLHDSIHIKPFDLTEEFKMDGDSSFRICCTEPFRSIVLDLYNSLHPLDSLFDPMDVPDEYFIGIPGTGDSYELSFKLNMQLKDGINELGGDMRIDEVVISEASFVSKIVNENFGLKWSDIDSINVVLGQHMKSYAEKDSVQRIYTKGEGSISDFGVSIPISIKDFTVRLLEETPEPDWTEVDFINHIANQTDLSLKFYITIPVGETLHFDKKSKLIYSVDANFINYNYLYGWMNFNQFDFHHEGLVDLRKQSSDWEEFSRFHLPFSNPKIRMEMMADIAGNVELDVKNLYAVDGDGKRTDASFNGMKEHTFRFPAEELIDPLYYQPGDSTHMQVLLDNTAANGQIDQLFRTFPAQFGYNIGFNLGQTPFVPQVRFPSEFRCRTDIEVSTPLEFHQGMSIDYNDTIRDIDFESLHTDSLEQDLEWMDAIENAKLLLGVNYTNHLQTDVECQLEFLDKDLKPVCYDDGKPFILIADMKDGKPVYNTLILKGDGSSNAVPVRTMDHIGWNTLCKTHHIAIRFHMDDTTWQQNHPGQTLRINAHDEIDLAVVVAANLQAIINFNRK